MQKVYASFRQAGFSQHDTIEVVTRMQNSGILFREPMRD
jgi:hypothetical protein